MLDAIISELDAIGVPYEEDYDAGTLTIDISAVDKTELINLIRFLTDTTVPFTIDETTIIVTVDATPMEEETPVEEDFMNAALDEAVPMT
jgi:hypothetical protein